MDKKTELLKKLKALSERGVGGEKQNAAALLSKLMEKYGFTEDDIELDKKEDEFFPYKENTEKRLLAQIIFMVTGKSAFGCVGTYTGRSRKKLGVNCTAAEKLEIEAAFAFYKKAFEEELEVFYAAFAHKNHLFPENCKVDDRSLDELQPEERRFLLKMEMMITGMDHHTMKKALPGK